MSVHALYQQKRVTAEEALTHVQSGDFIIVPTGVGEPPALLTALSAHRRQFTDVKVAQILAIRELNIGHALIAEALYLGLDNVVNMYLQKLK